MIVLTIDIIPGLYKTYPNAAMQISLAATAAPVVSISPSGIDLLAGGELDIQVLTSPNTVVNALTFAIKTENIIKVRAHHLNEKRYLTYLIELDLDLLLNYLLIFALYYRSKLTLAQW